MVHGTKESSAGVPSPAVTMASGSHTGRPHAPVAFTGCDIQPEGTRCLQTHGTQHAGTKNVGAYEVWEGGENQLGSDELISHRMCLRE